MTHDPKLYENRAAAENSKKWMKKLKQIINYVAKISEIITNNNQATTENYAEFMSTLLEILLIRKVHWLQF